MTEPMKKMEKKLKVKRHLFIFSTTVHGHFVLLVEGNTNQKKKKRNRGKKKNEGDTKEIPKCIPHGQTDPPTVPIVKLYPDGEL